MKKWLSRSERTQLALLDTLSGTFPHLLSQGAVFERTRKQLPLYHRKSAFYSGMWQLYLNGFAVYTTQGQALGYRITDRGQDYFLALTAY